MVGFLQDTRAWIYYPKFVEFYSSLDGEEFTLLTREEKDKYEKKRRSRKKRTLHHKEKLRLGILKYLQRMKRYVQLGV